MSIMLHHGENMGEEHRPSSGEVGEEHIRPMFEISWAAMLAVFSMLLERSDEKHIVDLCLLGFRHAIHLASKFGLSTVRFACCLIYLC